MPSSAGKAVTSSEQGSQAQLKPNLPLFLIIAFTSAILLCVLMFMSGNKQASAASSNNMLLVQNAQVNTSRISLQEGFVKPRTVFGKLESAQQSNIGFELSGMLSGINITEGARVKKGDILAQLDTSRLKAQQNELNSALASAKANAKLAKLSARRVQALVERNLEPQQRLDEVDAQLDAANANVANAEARLNSVEVELQKTKLRAPFAGQIVRQYLDSGTVVSAGQALFSIIESSALEARFGLPEQTAFGVKPGQEYMVSINQVSLPAVVKSVAQERQLSTRTIDSVLTLDDSALSAQQRASLVSGDLVSLQVDIPVSKAGAWVPVTALASGVRGMWLLYVINSDQMVETRMVSIEYANQYKAFISGAIANNDQYVTEGIHRITPHQQVKNVHEVSSPFAAEKP